MASTVWTPAGAHQSLWCCEAKTARGRSTMSTSTRFRLGLGLGVGVGSGVGASVPPGAALAGTVTGVGSGVGGSLSSMSSGGSVTSTVSIVARSGGGPARNRSIRVWTEIQRSPAPNVFVAIASVVRLAPMTATPTAPTMKVRRRRRARRVGGFT